MILSDETIREQLKDKRIIIVPEPQDWQLQPASVDLTLGEEFMSPYEDKIRTNREHYTILPGECVLATTAEWIEVPDDLAARVEGKSSWGRRFIMAHVTAGFIDPGFHGNITLELVNLSRTIQTLDVGAAIAQISFYQVDRPVTRPYGSENLHSHYQDQLGVVGSALPWA